MPFCVELLICRKGVADLRKVHILNCVGLIIFMLGIYLSTFLSTLWVIVGTTLAMIGGGLIGTSSYFVSNPNK